MKILIIGGNGFIGARLAKALYEEGNKVYVTGRNNNFPVAKNIHFKKYDLLKSTEKNTFDLVKGMNLVIYAAGISAYDCEKNTKNGYEVNGNSVSKIIRSAEIAGVKKFIYISTVHVYSRPLDGMISEETIAKNIHPYSTSHLIGESITIEAANRGKIDCLILRLSNSFGVPVINRPSAWEPFINQICKQAVLDKKIMIHGNGQEMRDVISMEAVCEFIKKIVKINWNVNKLIIANLCSGHSYSIQYISEYIKKRTETIFGHSPPIVICQKKIDNISNEKPVFQLSKFVKNSLNHDLINLNEIDNILVYLSKV